MGWAVAWRAESLPWNRLIHNTQQNHQHGAISHTQIFYSYWLRCTQKRFKVLISLEYMGCKMISLPELRGSGPICCYKSQWKCENWGVLNEVLSNALSLAYHLVMKSLRFHFSYQMQPSANVRSWVSRITDQLSMI